jgi:hypothetical protein
MELSRKKQLESLQALRTVAFGIIFTSHISDNPVIGAGGINISHPFRLFAGL